MNADPEVMRHFAAPMDRAASDAFVDRIRAGFAGNGFGWWAVEVVGGAPFIGFVGLGRSRFVSFTAVSNVASQRVMQRLGLTHDPDDDFDHPALDVDSPLRRHVLYRLRR